jgi:hypothetical protein
MNLKLTSASNLQIEADGTPLNLSAEEVERLIRELAKFRKTMVPEVPRKPADGTYEDSEVDPILGVQPVVDHKALMVRHPGIGWLLFLLPENEAQKLGQHLVQPAPSTSTPHSQTRPH